MPQWCAVDYVHGVMDVLVTGMEWTWWTYRLLLENHMLSGVIPAMLTPFTEGGENVDLAGLERICDYLVEQGVGGVFVTGTTGEFISQTADERRLVIKEASRMLKGRTQVLVHVGSTSTADTVALTKHAVACGADGVGSLPPVFCVMDEEAVFQYFCAFLEAAGDTPAYLYNLPQCAGNSIGLDMLQRLKERYSNLKGIKDSSGDAERYAKILGLNLPDFTFICGADHLTFDTIRKGGTASVTSAGNTFPSAFQNIYDAYSRGDVDGARSAQGRLNSLTDALGSKKHVSACKNAIALTGVSVGTVRPPQLELTQDEIGKLGEDLQSLGFLGRT